MSKRSIVILVAVVAAALTLAITVSLLLSPASQIATAAEATWQETGEEPAYTMQIVKQGSAYLVTYPRWRYDREPFVLQGDVLVGDGVEATTNDAIAYDSGSEQLTISDGSGDYSYRLSRVAEPAGVSGILQVAGPFSMGSQPQANTSIEVRWGDVVGPVLASTTSGEQGEFRVIVAPGEYFVVPVAKGDELVLPDRVTVQAGSYAVAEPWFSVR